MEPAAWIPGAGSLSQKARSLSPLRYALPSSFQTTPVTPAGQVDEDYSE